MLRQIIVFTRDLNLVSCQAFAQSAKKKEISCLFFNPFNAPYQAILKEVLKGHCLVMPRTSGVLFDDWDLTLLRECINNGAISTHSPEAIAQLRDKDRQYLMLQSLGLNCVPTLIHRGPLTLNHLETFDPSCTWVIKTTRGNKGIGHQLLLSKQLISWWDKQLKRQDQRYIIQPFYENACEHRLLVLGKNRYLFEKKQGDSWKKNASSSEFIKAVATPEQEVSLKHIEKTIKEELGLHTFAVDLFVTDDTNTAYSILEINAHPGMSAASAALGPEVNLYDDFIDYFLEF